MRKIFAMMAVIIGFLAASCQQSWLDEVTSAETDFVINVAVPEDVTRSAGSNSALGAIGNIDLGEFDIRYILEVYDGNGTLAYGPLVNCEDNELATSFTLRLVPGRKYTFAVWADFVEQGKDEDYHYITANGLRNIKINEQNYDAMDESCDAFTGIAVIDNYNGTSTIDVELKRPFAKLRVVTTDINEMLNLTPSSATVSYTSNSFYTEFDAYTSDVKGEPAAFDGERVIDLTEKRYENESNPAESGVMTLFADYLFAKHKASGINFVMDVLDANGQPIPQVAFNTEIPVKRNNLTTIAGPILTDFNSVKVTIDPVFDGELEGILPTDNYDPRMVIRYTAPEKVEREDWTYSTFGANIIFHKFEDGKGAILFDGEVTKIGNYAFSNCSKLKSVTIPISVTMIGQKAFYSCSNLNSISIPSSVVTIGTEAFCTCHSLTSVTIPDSVTTLGNNPFFLCYNLTEFKGKLASEDGKCLIVDGNLKSFATGCGATEYTIPEGVTSIGYTAFQSCKSLTSVTIPETVTTIGEGVFWNCSNLAEFKGKFASEDGKCLVVNGNLNAFAIGCGATEYTIPNGVTKIGTWAFENCKSLTNVTIPYGVTEIGHFAFQDCDSLTSVTIPDSVTKIVERAFDGCSSLISVTIPDSVTSIGPGTFWNCRSLTEFKGKFASEDGKCLVVNGNLNAFAIGCGATEYVIPNGVTKIGIWAFYGCNSLASVTIPNSITKIDQFAFDQCKKLTSVYCKATTPPSSGEDIFRNNASDRKIYVPAESVDAYKTASVWSDYADAIVGYDDLPTIAMPANDEIWYTNGSTTSPTTPFNKQAFCVNVISNTYDAEKECWVIKFDGNLTSIGERAFYRDTKIETVFVPNSVDTIAEKAFYGCYNIKAFYSKFATNDNKCIIVDSTLIAFASGCMDEEYVLPSNVTRIGIGVFYKTNLQNIQIPDSVTSIGYDAFWSSNLKEIVIPDSVQELGSYTFAGCENLTTVKLSKNLKIIEKYTFQNCYSLSGIEIPNGVETIGTNAFYACSKLRTIKIPSSVKVIQGYAFYPHSPYSTRTLYIDDLTSWSNISFADEYSNPQASYLYVNNEPVTDIVIPNDVTSIKPYTYNSFSSIENIIIPQSVSDIKDHAFYYCYAKNITINGNINKIGYYAFGFCTKIESITLPNTVENIADCAFYYCSNLTSVYCKATIPPVAGKYMFENNASGRKIYVPAESVDAYKTASGWSNYASAIVGYDFN